MADFYRLRNIFRTIDLALSILDLHKERWCDIKKFSVFRCRIGKKKAVKNL